MHVSSAIVKARLCLSLLQLIANTKDKSRTRQRVNQNYEKIIFKYVKRMFLTFDNKHTVGIWLFLKTLYWYNCPQLQPAFYILVGTFPSLGGFHCNFSTSIFCNLYKKATKLFWAKTYLVCQVWGGTHSVELAGATHLPELELTTELTELELSHLCLADEPINFDAKFCVHFPLNLTWIKGSSFSSTPPCCVMVVW